MEKQNENKKNSTNTLKIKPVLPSGLWHNLNQNAGCLGDLIKTSKIFQAFWESLSILSSELLGKGDLGVKLCYTDSTWASLRCELIWGEANGDLGGPQSDPHTAIAIVTHMLSSLLFNSLKAKVITSLWACTFSHNSIAPCLAAPREKGWRSLHL